MRRFMTSMLAVLGALSTPLAAQARSDAAFGFTATMGAGWQIEAGEIGYARSVRAGPVRAVGASVRLGAFVDEGAIIGGSRGFVAAATLSARTGRAMFAEFGDGVSATRVGFDLTVEATQYLGTNSPLAVGPSWSALAVLPGVRVGGGDGPQYAFLLGVTAFLGGNDGDVRGLLSFRVHVPLARRRAAP